jgi:oxaloacetate decarboxylase gamma subunit
MTIFDMLGQSGILTVLGMGVVFGFLILMIIAVNIVGKAIHALGLDKDVAVKPASQTTGQNGAVTAAISAAVNEYQKK